MHAMPGNRRMWESHTKAGYYLGTSWDHYRCHEVWISNTKSKRVGRTVFLKHKYLIQPTITASDALLRSGNDICAALKNVAPTTNGSRRAIDFLMDIFKNQANSEADGVDAQRVQMKAAQTQRVQSDKEECDASDNETADTASLSSSDDETADTESISDDESIVALPNGVDEDDNGLRIHRLEIRYPLKEMTPEPAPMLISQDEDAPAANTRSARKRNTMSATEIQADRMKHLSIATDISGSCPSPAQSASRK